MLKGSTRGGVNAGEGGGQEWWAPPEVAEEAGFSAQGLVFAKVERMSRLRKWRGGGSNMGPFAEEVPRRLVASSLSEFGSQTVLRE